MSYNKVVLVGNVGQDPEVRTVSDKKVASVSLATSEVWKDKDGKKNENTEWHRLVAWSPFAEIIERFVKKGSQILVEGKLTYRSYDNKDGQKVFLTEIKVTGLTLLGKKSEEPQPERSEPQNQVKETDDDLPF